MSYPKRVIIFGGTHGNEWTGIQVISHYQDYLKKKFPQLTLEFVLANPEAHKLNRRYKDEDLNRAFQYLDEERSSYENKRAHEIKRLIDKSACFILDLHTTTSNMGSTLIVSHYNPQNLYLCSQLSRKINNCRIIACPDPQQKYLASQSPYGLILEVGPVPNSIVSAAALESTLTLIESLLEVILDTSAIGGGSLEVYEEYQDVAYPVDEKGELSAYIHSTFQAKDFCLLEGEFTPFKTFQGQEISMKLGGNLYPIFINEAAYYPQKLAFTLCQKKILSF